MQIRTFALISALALALPACTSQTLGNVQLTSHDGQVAVDAVNHQEARAIQAAVIAATREMHPVDGEATFLLLTGSTYGSYESVAAKLGDAYVLPDQAASDLPFYGVRSVRTQKDQGDVTVVVPSADKLGLVDVQVEAKKTAEGRNWEVVRLTDRPAAIHALADLIAEENKAVVVAPIAQAPEAEEPEVKAPEQAEEAEQPKSFNWFERNILGKQTEEQKAAAAAEKAAKAEVEAAIAEAKAAQEAEEKAAKAEAEAAAAEAKAAGKAAKAEAIAAKEAEEKAAKDAKAAQEAAEESEEAKQPESFNWFERNILGKQTEEQKAAAAAEKAAKAEAKAAKEAEEKAADEAKKAEKQAAEEAKAAAKAAEVKPAEEAQTESFNWFERNILGKQTEEQKAAAAAEKAAKQAQEDAAEAAAAEKAAAAKPTEATPATTGKKRSTWFESKVLGKDEAPAAEPAK